MSIHSEIGAYYSNARSEHHRYRSWEHCYGYFRRARRSGLRADRDRAALELAFYLASWGMYRGSGFLLQYAYTAHRDAVDVLADRQFDRLWAADFGRSRSHGDLIPQVSELIDALRAAYRPFAEAAGSRDPSDTLVTKIVLGTVGCLPACDRYFIDGFKRAGLGFSRVNDDFIERVLGFCLAHLPELRREQEKIRTPGGVRYPLMKLVDMYFWQVGARRSRTVRR